MTGVAQGVGLSSESAGTNMEIANRTPREAFLAFKAGLNSEVLIVYF
jgi:hypothetical protein